MIDTPVEKKKLGVISITRIKRSDTARQGLVGGVDLL
jgi:hypothetical protein